MGNGNQNETGKLSIKSTIERIEQKCFENGVEIIPIKAAHMDKTMSIPMLLDHKDPFDRLIMATALVEGMTLISTDEKVRRKEYQVDIVW